MFVEMQGRVRKWMNTIRKRKLRTGTRMHAIADAIATSLSLLLRDQLDTQPGPLARDQDTPGLNGPLVCSRPCAAAWLRSPRLAEEPNTDVNTADAPVALFVVACNPEPPASAGEQGRALRGGCKSSAPRKVSDRRATIP